MRVGIVGSGIAGLGAAWLLSRKGEVTLFEAENRLGGHAHTVRVDWQGLPYDVDTGFIVYSEKTYPLLTRLFRELGVSTRFSDMSFS
ncbi:MAG: FAD-dependent oxidoreductase, partial [Candidatus Hydrogenedentes bacterium]|nr:FAD-dependent oxidoreductase [Candidatus Hydrogenedentota bacterium]